jgi:hypothetical protein
MPIEKEETWPILLLLACLLVEVLKPQHTDLTICPTLL